MRRTAARERGLAVVVAVVAIGAWITVTSRPGLWAVTCGDCTTPGATPTILRVLQLNMLHGFPDFSHLADREQLLIRQITDRKADVVLLQEVPWTPETGALIADLGRRTGMTWAYRRANGNRRAILFEEGDAILSRLPLRDVSSVELPWGTDFFEHRTAVAAVVQTDAGPVRVVSTHLSGTPAGTAAAQDAALRAFVEGSDLPTVIGGDFNQGPSAPPIRALAGEWRDLLAEANPDDPGLTCCREPDDAAALLHERIDYLWLRGTARLVAAQRVAVGGYPVPGVGTLAVSDHVGLFAILDFGASGGSADR